MLFKWLFIFFVYKLYVLIVEDLENIIKHVKKNYLTIITHHHEICCY